MIKSIIPTLTIYNDIKKYEEYAKLYFELGISMVRVNMTRYNNQQYIKMLNILQEAYSTVSGGLKLKFLLDLPIPSKKPRIFYIGGGSGFNVKKNDVLYIVSNKEKAFIENNCIYIDDKYFYKSMFENKIKTLYTDDGRVIFECKYLNDVIVIRALTDGYVSYFKAVYSNLSNYSLSSDDELLSYAKTVSIIAPEIVALSFVEHSEQLTQFSNMVSSFVPKKIIQFMPKIETEQAVENLSKLIQPNGFAMFGRGDLLINSQIDKLGQYQEEFLDICQKRMAKAYIATDILPSLQAFGLPNRSDILDLFYINKFDAYGVIASAKCSSLLLFPRFVETVKKISDQRI